MKDGYRIDGERRSLMPLKAFRAQMGLPDDWGVTTFEPKQRPDMGHIDGAGAQLNALCHALVASVQAVPAPHMLPAYERLARDFESGLRAINALVGLNEAEIGFAVAGFSDANQTYAYACIRAHAQRQPLPDFAPTYHDWLMDGIRLSQYVHEYAHEHDILRVQTITNVYGRMGLKVVTGDDVVYYVADTSQACPVAVMMFHLMNDIATRMTGIHPDKDT